MSQPLFLETIAIQDGKIPLLDWHLARLQRTQQYIYGYHLIEKLTLSIPTSFQQGWVKCRILYARTIEEIAFSFYQVRTITHLRVVEAPHLNYSLKYADRSELEALKSQCQSTEDILITQNGYLTDTSFSNLVLFDGERYITPSTYILNGVRRQSLLASGIIQSQPVHLDELIHYQELYLINGMLDWARKIAIPIQAIIRS